MVAIVIICMTIWEVIPVTTPMWCPLLLLTLGLARPIYLFEGAGVIDNLLMPAAEAMSLSMSEPDSSSWASSSCSTWRGTPVKRFFVFYLREYLDVAQHPAMWQLIDLEVGSLLCSFGSLGGSSLVLPLALLSFLSVFIVLRCGCPQTILEAYRCWRRGRAWAQCHRILDNGSGGGKVAKLLVLWEHCLHCL